MSKKKNKNKNIDDEYKKLSKFMQEHERQEKRDATIGRQVAETLLKKIPFGPGPSGKLVFPIHRMSVAIASFLETIQDAESDHECRKLLMEWVFEKLWVPEVERHIEPYKQAYEYLKSNGYNRKNPLIWGDIDCGAWVEPAGDLKVIALTAYCAYHNDNTYVYILDENLIHTNFHARKAYPRMHRIIKGTGWDYVDRASLKLYRDQKFKLNHSDARDVGYCFSYSGEKKVDRAYYYQSDVYWALWNLRSLFEAIEEDKEEKK